ncbi:Aldo/keto reductase, partial [Sistotremastrum suecicum HHB10207 ss-3]
TAQIYRNEEEAGAALRETGVDRSKVYITTKYSGVGSIRDAIRTSLAKLGVSHVDLYLLHSPRASLPDITTAWREMERILDQGLAKSIGVSNYTPVEFDILFKTARVVPAVNQILFHPYVYEKSIPTLEYCKEKGIVIEAYSPLSPITRQPGGSLDKPLAAIAKAHNAEPNQILLAWAKAKGTVVITSSRQKERLQGYLDAGEIGSSYHNLFDWWRLSEDFVELSTAEIAIIDKSAAKN